MLQQLIFSILYLEKRKEELKSSSSAITSANGIRDQQKCQDNEGGHRQPNMTTWNDTEVVYMVFFCGINSTWEAPT